MRGKGKRVGAARSAWGLGCLPSASKLSCRQSVKGTRASILPKPRALSVVLAVRGRSDSLLPPHPAPVAACWAVHGALFVVCFGVMIVVLGSGFVRLVWPSWYFFCSLFFAIDFDGLWCLQSIRCTRRQSPSMSHESILWMMLLDQPRLLLLYHSHSHVANSLASVEYTFHSLAARHGAE
jgi:hypothetical protein